MKPSLKVGATAEVTAAVTEDMCPAFDGVVVHRNLNTVMNREAKRVVISRGGELVVTDADGKEIEHHPLQPGATVYFEDGEAVKKGALLINTARGSLLDDKAVLAALEEGRLAGVATDVYVKEPPEDFSLAKHERVIATPHIGAFTEESVERATVGAVENIIETLKKG